MKSQLEGMAKKYTDFPESLVFELIRIKQNQRAEYAKEVKNLYTNVTFTEDIAALARVSIYKNYRE